MLQHEPTIKLLQKIENITDKYPRPDYLLDNEEWDMADLDDAAQSVYFDNLNRQEEGQLDLCKLILSKLIMQFCFFFNLQLLEEDLLHRQAPADQLP